MVDENEIKSIINELSSKNSSGYDFVTTNLLKKLEPILVKPLTLIINQSLNTGIFPDKLKIAKVIPLRKTITQTLKITVQFQFFLLFQNI